MINMANFEHKEGNAVSFNGSFGLVELTFHRTDNSWDFAGGESIPSYFTATLFINGSAAYVGQGASHEAAIQALYAEYARYTALRDLGEI